MILSHKSFARYLLPSFLTQAIFGLNQMVMLILGGLSAVHILNIKYAYLATFPMGIMLLSSFIFTPMAGDFLNKYGNRKTFFMGILCNAAGALLFGLALFLQNFGLLLVASIGFGINQAFAGYLRFSTADDTSCCKKISALAMTVGGGTIAALLAPLFIIMTKDLTLPQIYLGTFIALSVVNMIFSIIPLFMQDNKLYQKHADTVQDVQWNELFTRKNFLPAAISGLASNGIMQFMVIITPIAMIGCGMNQIDASWVIQSHVIAMLIPSFISGILIGKIGKNIALLFGLIIMMVSCVLFYYGFHTGHLLSLQIATSLLGLGWGITYIASGSLLMNCYCPCDKTGVQSINEMVISSGSALMVLSSGSIYYLWGVTGIIIAALSLLVLAFIVNIKEFYMDKRYPSVVYLERF